MDAVNRDPADESRDGGSNPAPHKDKTAMASNPLRKEAEQAWAEQEKNENKRRRRGKARSIAQAKRRESARLQKDRIASLTGKLKRARKKLAGQRTSNPATRGKS